MTETSSVNNVNVMRIEVFDMTRDRWVQGTHITWEQNDFYLEASYCDKTDWSYWFYHKDSLVFHGSDFKPDSSVTVGSNVLSLLNAFHMHKNGVDLTYLSKYTTEQMLWIEKHGQDLAYTTWDLEYLMEQNGEIPASKFYVSVFSEENLAEHIIDFGVQSTNGFLHSLSLDGFKQLEEASAWIKIDWWHPGESCVCDCYDDAPPELKKARRLQYQLSRFPEDLRAALLTELQDNPSQHYYYLTSPVVQYHNMLVVEKTGNEDWLTHIMTRLGYAPPVSILERMLVLYPVVWGGADSRCLKKGKLGVKHRRRQPSYHAGRILCRQDKSLWVITEQDYRQVTIQLIGRPEVLETMPRQAFYLYLEYLEQ